jgi:hypothetical protein
LRAVICLVDTVKFPAFPELKATAPIPLKRDELRGENPITLTELEAFTVTFPPFPEL